MPTYIKRYILVSIFSVTAAYSFSANAQSSITSFSTTAAVINGDSFGGSGAYVAGVGTSSGGNFTGVTNTVNLRGWYLFTYTISGNTLFTNSVVSDSPTKAGFNGGASSWVVPSGARANSISILGFGSQQIALHFIGLGGGDFSVSRSVSESVSRSVSE